MMNSIFKISLFALVFFVSCQKEPFFLSEPEPQNQVRQFPGVNQELWPFFESFEKEAALRGIKIDLATERLTGVIENINQGNVAGICNYRSHLPNHVRIDKKFWESTSNLFKEFIVFHELGHCSLFRDHLESSTQRGVCTSIMRSGTGACRDNYHNQTRAAYLDELFLNTDGPKIN